MPTAFGAVLEEFEQELDAIQVLIGPGPGTRRSARVRVAGANAAVLLLAATFEEFVREQAREYARAVVASTVSYDKLPSKLATIAWKRTMEGLARIHLDPKAEVFSRESIFNDAQTRFAVTYQFCRGDLTQDVYQDLIHNENNMRPSELNSLFKISNLSNMCRLASAYRELQVHLGQEDQDATSGKVIDTLEEFFTRRNQTAHEIRASRSVSPDAIGADVTFLRLLGRALTSVLDAEAPAPIER